MLHRLWKKIKRTVKDSTSFGDQTIFCQDGKYVVNFDHLGETVTLSGENLEAVKDTLLSLKKVDLPPDEIIKRMTAWDYLRLYQCWSTPPHEGPYRRDEDDNLLLLDLIFYGTKGSRDGWQNKQWPPTRPWEFPVRVSDRGTSVCKYLFWANCKHYGEPEYLDDGMTPEQRWTWLVGPLIDEKLEDHVPKASDYHEYGKRRRSPDWYTVDRKMRELSGTYPLFHQLWRWHLNDRRRRYNLLSKGGYEPWVKNRA